MSHHGVVGESYMTACGLSEECRKFMESAKVVNTKQSLISTCVFTCGKC